MPSRRTRESRPAQAPAAAASGLAPAPLPAQAAPAARHRHDPNAFDAWSTAHLRETAHIDGGTRGNGSASIDTATLAKKGAVLEVRFADGSVLVTTPVDFVREHVPPPKPSRAGAAPDLSRIALPFELQSLRGTRTRAGGTGAAVDRYTVSELTEPTTLDTLFDVAETFRQTARRWFGVDATDTGALPVAAKLCAAFENAVLDDAVGATGGALLHWADGRWQPFAGHASDEARPVLLFLHGTASSTAGSFGKLTERKDGAPWPADWSALEASHLILGWEHRSLTLSPIDNTIALVDALLAALPGTAKTPRRIDVVSHSRGGLVGELFALRTAAVGADERARFAAHFAAHFEHGTPAVQGGAAGDGAGHPDAQRIDALFAALARAAKPLAPGCFVRVACPARGTLLADGRTDLFLSLMLRAVGLAAGGMLGGLGAVIYERFAKLVRSLVAARADAKTLPGLEAMMPGSALTLALAHCEAKCADRLRVVAGDAQPSGLSGLLTLVADVFYGWHDHDYVVHTRSMFGGLARTTPALSLRVESAAVSHFAYFGAGSESRGALRAALEERDEAFRPMADDEQQTRGSPAERARRGTRGVFQALKNDALNRPDFQAWLDRCATPSQAHKPVLVVLAGIMGSELSKDGKPVWLSLGAMLDGALEGLAYGGANDTRLQASGVLAVSYWRLLDRAQQQFNVIAIPFDWRRPIAASGALLAARLAQIDAAVKERNLPLHVLAHSMGGLVARHALYIDGDGRKLWQGLKARGSRLVQLGTPNRGSYAPAQLLLGQHGLSQVLGTLARKLSPKDLSRYGAGFPGLMEMLPQQADAAFDDLFQDAAWQQVQQRDANAVAPVAAVLAGARGYIGSAAFRQSFDALRADAHALYVAGSGDTVVQMRPATGGWSAAFAEIGFSTAPSIEFLTSPEGDGTVPWTSALAPERTWYAPCEHGTLPDLTEAFDAYFELLLTGSTRRLPQQGDAKRGAADDGRPVELKVLPPAPRAALVPTSDAELAELLLRSGADDAAASARAEPIEVRVVHGGLDYARHPLIVGHYLNERATGAAKRVDEKLDGQLGRLLALKLFEGAARTAHYLRPNDHTADKPSYPGALLLGLGTIGELTPAVLSETVTRGVLRYAFEHIHRDPYAPPGDGPVELCLSSVLIGTQIQAVTIRDSLAGLLYGVWSAAQLMCQMGAASGIGRAVRIRELELIEIDEGTALDAAYELKRLLERSEWAERIAWPRGLLETREGAMSGYRQRGASGTWQRLMVEQDEAGGLAFALIGERARVESTQVHADVASLRRFMDRISDDRPDAGDALTGATDPRLGGVLFQLLLPNDLKSRLANLDNTVLVVDDETAAYPWELLSPPLANAADGDVPRPFVVHAGMVRQRKSEDFRRLPQPVSGWNALVIGAPSTAGWSDERGEPLVFADLPGARREAEEVARLLRDDARPWKTLALIGSAPASIGTVSGAAPGEAGAELGFEKVRVALLERPCRLLHLCGHGVVEQWIRRLGEGGPDAEARVLRKTGLVLSHQELLGAADVEQMSPAPEFVFINACYSGRDGAAMLDGQGARGGSRVAGQRAKQQAVLAASLAQRFIAMGTKAVVAAGWQVDDSAALDFARAFYDALLGRGGKDGLPFGEAVKAARTLVHSRHGERCNTWGAYQCYGDPQWRLLHEGGDSAVSFGSSRLHGAEQCMSAGELAARILQIEAVAGDKPPAELVDQLRELLTRLAADPLRSAWLHDSRVRAALGTAYRELGEHRVAAGFFQRGARSAYSQVQIGQLDALANSLSREGSAEGRRAAQRLLELLEEISDDRDARWPLNGDEPPEPTAASERRCQQGEEMLREASAAIAALPEAFDAAHGATVAARDALYGAAATFAQSYVAKRREGDELARCAHALASALIAVGLARLMHVAPPALGRAGRADALWWLDEADRLAAALATADDLSDFSSGATQVELLGARHLYALTLTAPLKPETVRECRAAIDQVMVRWPSPIELEGLRHRFDLVGTVARRLPARGEGAVAPQLGELARYVLEQMLQPRYVRRTR